MTRGVVVCDMKGHAEFKSAGIYGGVLRRAAGPVRGLGRDSSTKVPHAARGRVVATASFYSPLFTVHFRSLEYGESN